MEANLFDPKLKTHPLTGDLAGHFASACGFDCRVVFRLEREGGSKVEKIILVSVGPHDAVY